MAGDRTEWAAIDGRARRTQSIHRANDLRSDERATRIHNAKRRICHRTVWGELDVRRRRGWYCHGLSHRELAFLSSCNARNTLGWQPLPYWIMEGLPVNHSLGFVAVNQ